MDAGGESSRIWCRCPVLSCSDNQGGAACQRGISENKAYAGAIATAGLIYLPGECR